MSAVKFVEKTNEEGASYEYADMRQQFPGYVRRDGSGAGLDTEAIANAEKELSKIASGFDVWLGEDIDAFLTAHANWLADPGDGELRGRFFRKAFDLRGQATTLGQPLVGDIAGSLAILLDSIDDLGRVPMRLVEAHVSSIKAVMAAPDGESDDLARELADTLHEASQVLMEKHGKPEVDDSGEESVSD